MATKNNPGKFDCYAKAGDDEPLFVLRAKDPKAVDTVAFWIRRNKGIQPEEKLAEALKCCHDMQEWRKKNGLEDGKPRLEMRDFV